MLLMFSAIALFSCSSEKDTSNNIHIFNTTVASSLNDFKQSFNAKRAELKFISGVKVNSCDAYSKEVKKSKVSEGVNNQIARSEYLLCDALQMLGNQPYSVMKADENISHTIANNLDLRSFPSSFGPRLDDESHTLRKIVSNNLAIKGNSVVYETADWYFKLELIAANDINANNIEDWILWVADESKTGNYRSYQTIVIYDVDTSKNTINAKTYPGL